jgi:hypothetical protein
MGVRVFWSLCYPCRFVSICGDFKVGWGLWSLVFVIRSYSPWHILSRLVLSCLVLSCLALLCSWNVFSCLCIRPFVSIFVFAGCPFALSFSLSGLLEVGGNEMASSLSLSLSLKGGGWVERDAENFPML